MKTRTPKCSFDYNFKMKMVLFLTLLFTLLTVVLIFESLLKWLSQFFSLQVVISGCLLFLLLVFWKLALKGLTKLWHMKLPEIFHHH